MTTRILLPHEDAVLPNDGGTVRPAFVDEGAAASSATAGTPNVTLNPLVLVRDTANDHAAMWTFRLPADYLSAPLLVVKFSATSNVGNVLFAGGICPFLDANTQIAGALFNAADQSNGGAGLVVPGTVGQSKEVSWALTATNVAAGELLVVFLSRRSTQAADSCTGDVNVLAVEFEYTS